MALNELSPYSMSILGRRDRFRNTVANRLARGELIVSEEVIRAPRPGYITDIAPDQSVMRMPDGRWVRYTFKKPTGRMALHWLIYQRDYCLLAWGLFLYILFLQVL